MAIIGQDNTPVLIVGAGPVGLALACELLRHGIRPRIIDRAQQPSIHSKALGVQPRTMEVFDQMGIAERFLAVGHPVAGLVLNAGEQRLGRIGFEAIESPYPFVTIVPQSQTEQILIGRLEELGVQVERGLEFHGSLTQTDEFVQVKLLRTDGAIETSRTPWLVGCDGSRGAVRTQLGIPFEGQRYDEQFVLADVQMTWSHSDHEMNAFLHADGALVGFPMGHGKYRIVATLPQTPTVTTRNAENGQDHAEPSLADIRALLARRGLGDAVVSAAGWLSRFHIARRRAATYRCGRCFIAGDAAHVHSPVGGQGMNTGIQDAQNLAWKLALIVKGQSPASLLDSYAAERIPVADEVLRMTDRMTRAITLRNPIVQRIRNNLVPVLTRVSAVPRRLARVITEMSIVYAQSSIVTEHWTESWLPGHRGGAAPGTRAPDAALRTLAGKPVEIRTILRDPRHVLLCFEGHPDSTDGTAELHEISRSVARKHPDQVAVHWIADRSSGAEPNVNTLIDENGAARNLYGADSACLYLVRPDRYIGYRARPARAAQFSAYLRELFGSPAN